MDNDPHNIIGGTFPITMPYFSIIVPTYQAEATISTCLKSILAQDFVDFEVIIQDGLSTDQTVSLVKQHNDPRIRLFIEKDNGVYDAINRAVDQLSGQWVLFLGSDDRFFSSDILSAMHRELNRTSARLVYGNVKISGNTPWAKDGSIYRGETPLQELVLHNYSHQALFYHRSIFDAGHRYKTQYRICADYDFNLFCTANYQVRYIPATVAVFTSGGISSVLDDPAFDRDKWMNIIRYFGYKLTAAHFAPFRKEFKKAAPAFLKQNDFSCALKAYILYLWHKLRR